jgi:hypothetical protein
MIHEIWWSLPLTLVVFFLARRLAARFKFPLLNPLLVAMVVLIPFLLITGISYQPLFPRQQIPTTCCSRRWLRSPFLCMSSCANPRPLEVNHHHLLYWQRGGNDHRHHRPPC